MLSVTVFQTGARVWLRLEIKSVKQAEPKKSTGGVEFIQGYI